MLEPAQRRRSLHQRLANIWADVDRLRSERRALAPSTCQLLEDLNRLLLAVAQDFEQRYAEAAGTEDELEDRADLCDEMRDRLKEVEVTVLPILRGAHSASIPVEFEGLLRSHIEPLEAVETTADGTTSAPRCVPVLSSSSSQGYDLKEIGSLTKWAHRGLDDKLGAELGKRRYIAASIPRLMRDAASLHAILLGHEVGHFVEWEHGISRTALGLPETPEELLTDDESSHTKTTKALYRRVATSWATEFTADAVAVLLMGPAAPLALAELTADVAQFNVDTLTHPGGDRRVHFMIEALDTRGFTSELPESLRQAVEIARHEASEGWHRHLRLPDPDSERDDEYTAFQFRPTELAWEWLKPRAANLVEGCAAHLSRQLSPSDLTVVEDAASDLLAGRPHGERVSGDTYEPVNSAVVLNAAWAIKGRTDGLQPILEQLGLGGDSGEELGRAGLGTRSARA